MSRNIFVQGDVLDAEIGSQPGFGHACLYNGNHRKVQENRDLENVQANNFFNQISFTNNNVETSHH